MGKDESILRPPLNKIKSSSNLENQTQFSFGSYQLKLMIWPIKVGIHPTLMWSNVRQLLKTRTHFVIVDKEFFKVHHIVIRNSKNGF